VKLGGFLLIAVGTLVPAAIAVPATAHACPYGIELQLDDLSQTWSALLQRPTRDPLDVAHERRLPPPRLVLRVGTDGGHAIRRAIATSDSLARCGPGRGEVIVRVARGEATVQVSGFETPNATCVKVAVERTRYTRIADGSIARIAIDLP